MGMRKGVRFGDGVGEVVERVVVDVGAVVIHVVKVSETEEEERLTMQTPLREGRCLHRQSMENSSGDQGFEYDIRRGKYDSRGERGGSVVVFSLVVRGEVR